MVRALLFSPAAENWEIPDASVQSENMETTKSLYIVFEQDGLRRKYDEFSGSRWKTGHSYQLELGHSRLPLRTH